MRDEDEEENFTKSHSLSNTKRISSPPRFVQGRLRKSPERGTFLTCPFITGDSLHTDRKASRKRKKEKGKRESDEEEGWMER